MKNNEGESNDSGISIHTMITKSGPDQKDKQKQINKSYVSAIHNLYFYSLKAMILNTVIATDRQSEMNLIPYLFRYYLRVRDGDFHTVGHYGTSPPTGWFHVVFNYIGPEDGKGTRVYYNGRLVVVMVFKMNYLSCV